MLEWAARRWLLDFGMRFGPTGEFFEEFVQPRGLRDYLRMGLIPPLKALYRNELSIHDPGLWARYRSHPQYGTMDRVDGVLLSHGHVDHVGSIGSLREAIPVYTGLTTALIGKCHGAGPAARSDHQGRVGNIDRGHRGGANPARAY